ncbi:MAG: UDP-N-acetylglucosamine 2-epimerase (non-hydrolyzing) [Candidatus Coatesbacteria bacterium]|nr:UDP-N-acetylglucosamine 2-epimerase (non-hydrolyzing) [Candidatus Coatesbacteria bacterium]
MKIFSIIGARPQFIKSALLSQAIREFHKEFLLHTGQHYDFNMSGLFFKELGIPEPDINLNVGSGYHGEQTAQMIIGIERYLLKEKPDLVLIYGDTNSTLAGAIASAKLMIPVAHVEAGLRSYNRKMPEEINRIVADCFSTFCFCPCENAARNLEKEGIKEGIYIVGDVMFDLLKKWEEGKFSYRLDNKWAEEYWLMTFHRAENTVDPEPIKMIFNAIYKAKIDVYFPAHPRTRKFLNDFSILIPSNLHLIDPLGYPETMSRLKDSKGLITDSGGLQKEAYWLSKPCITLREQTEWIETVEEKANKVVGLDADLLFNEMTTDWFNKKANRNLYGDGESCKKIVEIINHGN